MVCHVLRGSVGPATRRIVAEHALPHDGGKALDFARVDWPKVRPRPEFSRPGVYVLTGVDEAGKERIYIGEADVLRLV